MKFPPRYLVGHVDLDNFKRKLIMLSATTVKKPRQPAVKNVKQLEARISAAKDAAKADKKPKTVYDGNGSGLHILAKPIIKGDESWTHSLRQRDKWQLRSLQARISLERKESHDETITTQPLSVLQS